MKHPDAPDIKSTEAERGDGAAGPLLHPPRRDRLERRKAACKATATLPLNARGRGAGAHCGGILRDLFERDGRDAAQASITSPARSSARARPWNWRARALGLAADGYRDRAAADRDRLRRLGRASPSRSCTAATRSASPQREHDKWHFLPPGGESYKMVVGAHAGLVRRRLTRDTVVAAHGGTARGLIASARHRQAGGRAAHRYRAGRGLCVRGRHGMTRYA